jgi:hypothetical protein
MIIIKIKLNIKLNQIINFKKTKMKNILSVNNINMNSSEFTYYVFWN